MRRFHRERDYWISAMLGLFWNLDENARKGGQPMRLSFWGKP